MGTKNRTHVFERSERWGRAVEVAVATHLAPRFLCRRMGRPFQQAGVDFLIERHEGYGERYSLEVKGDYMLSKTGNAFVEVWSDYAGQKPGWAVSSTAQLLAYVDVVGARLWLGPMLQVKNAVYAWEHRYSMKEALNVAPDGSLWRSQGILVPVKEFAYTGRLHESPMDPALLAGLEYGPGGKEDRDAEREEAAISREGKR